MSWSNLTKSSSSYTNASKEDTVVVPAFKIGTMKVGVSIVGDGTGATTYTSWTNSTKN